MWVAEERMVAGCGLQINFLGFGGLVQRIEWRDKRGRMREGMVVHVVE